MKKINFLQSSIAIGLGCLMATPGYAEEFTAVTADSPAQILVKNASRRTAAGTQYASIHLIAKDHKDLHRDQVYQGNFSAPNPANGEDGSYNEADGVFYILDTMQADALRQATLKCAGRQQIEYTVIDVSTLVIKPPQNQLVNSESGYKVRLSVPRL